MNFAYITPELWEEFENKYPSAYAMLLRASLVQEKKVLEQELKQNYPSVERKTWIVSRLIDLSYLEE